MMEYRFRDRYQRPSARHRASFLHRNQGKKTAGIIPQQRIDAKDVPSAKVIFNSPFIIGAICRIGAIRAFSLWFQAYAGFPFVHANGTVAGVTGFALPAAGVYIRTALEPGKEQRVFFMHRAALCDCTIGRCLCRFFRNMRNNRRRRNAVCLQQQPELHVFCAQLVNDSRPFMNSCIGISLSVTDHGGGMDEKPRSDQ